jgi:hypothetical protein
VGGRGDGARAGTRRPASAILRLRPPKSGVVRYAALPTRRRVQRRGRLGEAKERAQASDVLHLPPPPSPYVTCGARPSSTYVPHLELAVCDAAPPPKTYSPLIVIVLQYGSEGDSARRRCESKTDNINGCVGRRRKHGGSAPVRTKMRVHRARRRGEDGPIYTRPARIALQRASSLKNAIGWKGCALRFPFWRPISSNVPYAAWPASAGDAPYAPDVLRRHPAATFGVHPASTIMRSCGLRSVPARDTPETMFAADGVPSYSGICGAYPTRAAFALTLHPENENKVFATRPKMSAWTGAGVQCLLLIVLWLWLWLWDRRDEGESVHRGGRVGIAGR